MNNALLLRCLHKWRSDRLLNWVFPHAKNYTVVTWRRINPRYDMSYGDFKGINNFQIVDISFRRTHLGALLVQFIMGRNIYSDGFRQQVVIITEPRGDYLKPPDTSAYDFDGYPSVVGFDSGVDMCNDEVTYGEATTAETEGDLYEQITGHRLKPLDDAGK